MVIQNSNPNHHGDWLGFDWIVAGVDMSLWQCPSCEEIYPTSDEMKDCLQTHTDLPDDIQTIIRGGAVWRRESNYERMKPVVISPEWAHRITEGHRN